MYTRYLGKKYGDVVIGYARINAHVAWLPEEKMKSE